VATDVVACEKCWANNADESGHAGSGERPEALAAAMVATMRRNKDEGMLEGEAARDESNAGSASMPWPMVGALYEQEVGNRE